MAVWKRAMLYLLRKKGRGMLLIVLIFMMSCFIMIGISLKVSADREISNLRKNLGTGFVLESDVDNQVYYKTADTSYSSLIYAGPKITPEMIKRILDVDGVTDYSIDSLEQMAYTDLNLKPGRWTDSTPSGNFSLAELEVMRHTTWIRPCEKGDLEKNFRTGAVEISQGRNIQSGDRCKAVISEWLAKENGLSIGDTFIIETKEGNYRPSDEPAKTWGEPIELEIVGIFHTNFVQAISEYTPEKGIMENNIYTDLYTYDIIEENLTVMFPKNEDYIKVTFFVQDPEETEKIMRQVGALEEVNVDGLLLSADDTAYKASAKPYGQIRTFAMILFIAGAVGMGIILYLVMRLWVQGRMHEAGILISLGMGRRNVIGQMLAESLTAAAAALILAAALSGTVVDKCMDFAEQATEPKANAEIYEAEVDYWQNPVVTQVSAEKAELEHGVSGYEIILMGILVCGVSSVSVLLAAIRIMDIEPKKLLRSM